MLRFLSVWDRLRASFWLVPGLMAIGSISLSLVAVYLDRELGAKFAAKLGWAYSGGAEGARSVLSAIASSVMGVAGTTFSITTAVLSLTSGQFGPRLLRNFMRDVGNQVVLGTFTSTFLYCLLVLRTVRDVEDDTYVPHISVTVGVALAVLSVGVLIYFIHHVAESIQVSHLIEEVGKDADDSAIRLFPEQSEVRSEAPPAPEGEAASVCSRRAGYVGAIDEHALLRAAERRSLVIRIEVRPGEYVLPGMRLLSVWPPTDAREKDLAGVFSYGRSRTTVQDVEFAFLQLSEVAVRALSPGINDPFTAMMCIDRITASMCVVVGRMWPTTYRRDSAGTIRLFSKPNPPAALVEAAFSHIRHAAQTTPVVLQKLRVSLTILIERAHEPELRAALQYERSQT